MNQEREDRLARHQAATGEKPKAGAIDVAVKHYLADPRAKREVVPDLEADLAQRLSTTWLPIKRETTVGMDS